MSDSKASIIEKLNHISDDRNEEEIIERLYMLMRLEHSQNRCEREGVYSDEEVAEHFAAKKLIIDSLSEIPDDIQDEFEVMENLYKLLRFKKSQQSVAENGGYTTDEVHNSVKLTQQLRG